MFAIRRARLTFCLSLLSATACSGGGSTLTSASQQATTEANTVDHSFINGAAMSSNAEIGAAQLAVAKSPTPDVVAFANEMITDHTAENKALDPIGDALGIPPQTGIGPMMQAVAAQLMALSGTAFDAAYINSEITGHENNLNGNYTPELSSGFNTNVKGYANTYDPQVSSHLSQAQAIKAKFGY